jgi:hypothetical protein
MEINLNIFNLNGTWLLSVQDTGLNFRPIYGKSRQDVINKLESDGDSYFCLPGAKCTFIEGETPKVRIL